jgi:ABC-type Fe3+/spermidine/putrescine transport system ATPase subunit
MSDRLAVMSEGRVVQVGPPREVYEEPADAYVADFLGVSNLMDARGLGAGRVRVGDVELAAGRGDTDATGDVRLVIRPERVRVEDRGTDGANRLPGMVERSVFVGPTVQVIVRLVGGQMIQAVETSRSGESRSQGDAVAVHLPADDLRVLRAAEPSPIRERDNRPATSSTT